MMEKFCYSCGAPVDMPEFKGLAKDFCRFCTDEEGKLKSQEEVRFAIGEWFKMWQPNLDQEKALERAAHYMKAMPAWTE